MCLSETCTVHVLCFAWFGATSCLLPFLTLHMKAVGVPALQSAFISGALPLFQLLTFPLALFVAKRSTSYKKATMWLLLFTAATTVLLVFSPSVPSPKKRTISMNFQCGPSIQPTVLIDRCNHECDDIPSMTTSDGVEAQFTECHVDCPGKTGTFKNIADLCFDDGTSRVCHVVEVNNTLSSEKFTFGMYLGKPQRLQSRKCLYQMEGASWHQSHYHIVSCPIILKESNTKCALRCDLQEIRTKESTLKLSGDRDCLEESQETVDSAVWVYFCLRAVHHFVLAIASVLLEQGMLYVIKTKQISRSKYAAVSLVAAGVFTPIAGVLLELGKESDVTKRYGSLIISCSSLILFVIILMSSTNLDDTQVPPITGTVYKTFELVRELEIAALFLVVFFIGSISGFLDTFLFWYLESISCPYFVMGATVTVGLIFGLPLSLKRFAVLTGKTRSGYVVCVCFFLQSIRYFGYFSVSNFWWCIPLELLGALAFHLLWSSVTDYGRYLLPKKYNTAYQISTGAVHYGFGRCCGALAGGIVMANFGFPTSFLGIGSVSGILGVIYLILYHFVFKGLPKNLMDIKDRKFDKDAETENRVTLLRMSSTTESVVPRTDEDGPEDRRDSETSSTSDEFVVPSRCYP